MLLHDRCQAPEPASSQSSLASALTVSKSNSALLSSPRSSPRSVMGDIFSSTVLLQQDQSQQQRLFVPREFIQFIDDDEYDDYAEEVEVEEEDFVACSRQQQYADSDERCLQSDDETDACTYDASTTEEKDDDPLLSSSSMSSLSTTLSLDATIEPIDSTAIDDVLDEMDRLQDQLDQELMDLLQGQATIARFRVNVIQSILNLQDQQCQQNQQKQKQKENQEHNHDDMHEYHRRRHHHHREDRWAPVVPSATTTRTASTSPPRASASFSGYTSPFWSHNSYPTKSSLSFSCCGSSKKTDAATKAKKSVRFLLTR